MYRRKSQLLCKVLKIESSRNFVRRVDGRSPNFMGTAGPMKGAFSGVPRLSWQKYHYSIHSGWLDLVDLLTVWGRH